MQTHANYKYEEFGDFRMKLLDQLKTKKKIYKSGCIGTRKLHLNFHTKFSKLGAPVLKVGLLSRTNIFYLITFS